MIRLKIFAEFAYGGIVKRERERSSSKLRAIKKISGRFRRVNVANGVSSVGLMIFKLR